MENLLVLLDNRPDLDNPVLLDNLLVEDRVRHLGKLLRWETVLLLDTALLHHWERILEVVVLQKKTMRLII